MTVNTKTYYSIPRNDREYEALLRHHRDFEPNPHVVGHQAGAEMKKMRDPKYGNVNAEYAQVINPVGQHQQGSHPGNIANYDDEVSAKNRTGNLALENSQTIVDKDPEQVVEDGITSQVGRSYGGFDTRKLESKMAMFADAFEKGNAHDGNNNRFNTGRLG